MKILITGGAGFIGTHLSRSLLQQGHSLTILDNFLPQVHGGNRDVAPDLRGHVRLIPGDVADESAWAQALPGAECVVHLAAETGTGQSMYEVARYERVNGRGTALLYDALAKNPRHGVRRIVVASSRSIYGEGAYRCAQHGFVYPQPRSSEEKRAGNFDPLCPVCNGEIQPAPTPETAPLDSQSFYALSKQMQEQMVMLFGRVLGIASVAVRYQNVYGPGQSLRNPYTGILAVFSNLARLGETIQIFEDGQESRDFVYVDDVVRATAQAATADIPGTAIANVGSNARTSVLEVAERINAYYGNKSEMKITGAFREGDIRHGVADLTLSAKILGYAPKWNFADGLQKFLDWAGESEPSSEGYERSLAEMAERGLMRGGS